MLPVAYVGNYLPIAFSSRTFNKAERCYSTTDRDMAPVLSAVKQFRPLYSSATS
jgi:hypothetical protein